MFYTNIYRDCDSSFCVKLINNCERRCFCVAIIFKDGTVYEQTLFSPTHSFLKLCFGKEIKEVRYREVDCPRCELLVELQIQQRLNLTRLKQRCIQTLQRPIFSLSQKLPI